MRRTVMVAIAAPFALAGAMQPLAAQQATDVVALHNAAYTQGNFDAYIATFADDAVLLDEGLEVRGRAAIAQTMAPAFAEDAPRAQIKRQGRIAGGGIRREESLVFSDGTEMCCTVSAIYVRDGRVARLVIERPDLGG